MLRAMGASGGAQKNILFNNLDPLPELIDEQVREDLNRHIVPSTSTQLPAVPNFSMEAKGALGTNREASSFLNGRFEGDG
ncbi:hypothetical protein E6O75_ATG09972 [Venturia nashicola]|uniref:Uncharacterized protein n=1 Tax=Venturia nashicola TaxID=86259 RepID=A0A4Z1NWH7_9PEZI|nr:hypothetical protein E6O75_ATG09972 [Venturia nashicola]